MESVLAVLCIIFFVVLTYGLIQGNNLQTNHKYNCRVIYIPEDIDLETAFESVDNKNTDQLKKRARELGGIREFVDSISDLELKVFIVQHSIGEEHIPFNELEQDILSVEEVRSETRGDIRETSEAQISLQNPEITIQELQEDFTE
jgi:hypothetical protein